jgi:hypothetical protein
MSWETIFESLRAIGIVALIGYACWFYKKLSSFPNINLDYDWGVGFRFTEVDMRTWEIQQANIRPQDKCLEFKARRRTCQSVWIHHFTVKHCPNRCMAILGRVLPGSLIPSIVKFDDVVFKGEQKFLRLGSLSFITLSAECGMKGYLIARIRWRLPDSKWEIPFLCTSVRRIDLSTLEPK